MRNTRIHGGKGVNMDPWVKGKCLIFEVLYVGVWFCGNDVRPILIMS